MSGLPKTTAGVLEALRRYEAQNPDLDPKTRRLLGLAAIGRYFGRRRLEEALGQTLPRTFSRDWGWRWWNVLLHSGLGEEWDRFASEAQRCSIRYAAQTLRKRCSRRAYLDLLRRAGTNPHNAHRRAATGIVWTKGGCWLRDSNLTRLLVLKEHLPPRSLNRWQAKLGHEGVRLLEREIMRLVDPNKQLRHECIDQAMFYVKRRVPEMLGWPQQKSLGPKGLAWFFQCRINTSVGTLVPKPNGGYILRRDRRQLVAW